MKGFSEQATWGNNGELKNSLAHPPYVATPLQDSLCGWNGAHGWHRAQIHRSKLEGAEPCAMLQQRFWVGMFVSKHVFFTFDFPQQPPKNILEKVGQSPGRRIVPGRRQSREARGRRAAALEKLLGKPRDGFEKTGDST